MTQEELDIWRNAYSSAYVSGFFRELHFRYELKQEDAWDKTMTSSRVEQAMDVADRAVMELREWRATEDRLRGVEL